MPGALRPPLPPQTGRFGHRGRWCGASCVGQDEDIAECVRSRQRAKAEHGGRAGSESSVPCAGFPDALLVDHNAKVTSEA